MNRRSFIRRAIAAGFSIWIPKSFGQTILEAPGLAAFGTNTPAGGGGGGGGFTFLGSVSGTGASNLQSPSLDTTGATALFAIVTGGALTHPTITDSQSNTWVADVDWNGNHVSIFRCLNPGSKVNAAHTVTVGNGNTINVIFLAFSGSGTHAFDSASAGGTTGNWNGATVNAGSLTPSGSNNLFIAAAWWDVGAGGAGDTVDSSFTKVDAFGTNPGCGGAYFIASGSNAAKNPGWKHTGAADGIFIQTTYTP
jgi:hypothetical protein